MHSRFKVGDRVRSKQTGCLGTVVAAEGLAGGAAGAAGIIRVEWDGRNEPPVAVSASDIYAIRPPPRAMPTSLGAQAQEEHW
jgi:hypothetical protein